MPFNPVLEDTHDKFTGARTRVSHPAKVFGSGIPRDTIKLALGFVESGDSAQLFLTIVSDASSWRFYSDLWILASDQRYQFQLSRANWNTYILAYNVRCVEVFSVFPIDSELLRKMLASPRWELRLSGHTVFETAIGQILDSWRLFYNAVIDPSSFPNVSSRGRAGCVGVAAFSALGLTILLYLL